MRKEACVLNAQVHVISFFRKCRCQVLLYFLFSYVLGYKDDESKYLRGLNRLVRVGLEGVPDIHEG